MEIIDFYEYIYNRQALAKRKQRFPENPDVWTKDPILKKYRFCNVRRYDDAGTRHLVEHVIKNPGLGADDILLNIILYRWFNVRNFFTQIIGGPVKAYRFNANRIIEYMDTALENGLRLFNDAYMICGIPSYKHRSEDKHVQCILRAQDISLDKDFYKLKNCNNAVGFMRAVQFPGKGYLIGPFLAYQITIDWSYWKDGFYGTKTLNYCGPGTIWTLNSLFPKVRPEEGLEHLFVWQDKYFNLLKKQTGKNWKDVCGKEEEISITDIENCLCEFRKYSKIKQGLVQRKRYYYAVS